MNRVKFIESVPRTVFNSNFSLMHEIRDVFSFEISRPFSRDGFKTSPQLVLNANFPYENTKRNKIDLTCLDSLRLDMTFGIWLMSRQSRTGLARFVYTNKTRWENGSTTILPIFNRKPFKGTREKNSLGPFPIQNHHL